MGLGGILTAEEIATVTGGRVVRGDPATRVSSVSTDSRSCQPGALFVALQGARRDGHDFVGEAQRRGAAAALVCRPVDAGLAQVQVSDTRRSLLPLASAWRARFAADVVGVTGSVGKSTTVQMVAAVLRARYPTWASRPEWNAELGVPLTVFGLAREHRYLVVELAMRGLGQIAELCRVVRPSIGVVTRVGPVHTEQLGSVEAVAKAKAELVQALPADGVAVLNGDDPRVRGMAPHTAARVVLYGTAGDCAVRAEGVQVSPDGVRFLVRAGKTRVQGFLPVPSTQLVANALAAFAVGLEAGVPLEEAAEALRGFQMPPMRLQVLQLPGEVVVVNDAYNASPLSVEAALEAVRPLRAGRRLVAVLGEMRELGQLHELAHREVGRLCAREGVDVLVVVGEGARELAAAALEAGLPPQQVRWVADAGQAAQQVLRQLQPGDVVLVKGSRAVALERVVESLWPR
ncbi:MAG: UDP-N-acetylmuramoyl-tripeptide--D-alanyl-D-alanine ligase [Armatimonadota bacterium]|nr:UDP-N-acetylmuramoyl-tripeptide--D-alanyl-D-alanine ligase [Armatimonadota bacterium]MDW8156917.1 UDP-N-acetylmuramoyl-tripeptide--D-alanyl-D-alanine ligase [Armatimonadota bacterium]